MMFLILCLRSENILFNFFYSYFCISGTMQVEDFKDKKPELILEKYFLVK